MSVDTAPPLVSQYQPPPTSSASGTPNVNRRVRQLGLRASSVSAGYGDKLRRAIGAADPGAVPGGSTKTSVPAPAAAELLTGPNQDRRVLKSAVFARAE